MTFDPDMPRAGNREEALTALLHFAKEYSRMEADPSVTDRRLRQFEKALTHAARDFASWP